MPLTPALLARLKRRGVIQEENNEEVIAESYDTTDASTTTRKDKSNKNNNNNNGSTTKNRGGAPFCPNKYNPYHYCVSFCYQHWKETISENSLPTKYMEERAKILKKYPLPNGWKEVYDSGCGRHYYWNARTDEVSWLPPRHPLAVIGDAAPKVSKELFEKKENTNGLSAEAMADKNETNTDNSTDKTDINSTDKGAKNNSKSDSSSLALVSSAYRDNNKHDEQQSSTNKRKRPASDDKTADTNSSDNDNDGGDDPDKTLELTDRDKLRRAKRKGIDPMDPAAYGDNVAVGTWSSGLHTHDRSGADVTASGPLFQQRPYPAPGAVLRKQQQQRGTNNS